MKGHGGEQEMARVNTDIFSFTFSFFVSHLTHFYHVLQLTYAYICLLILPIAKLLVGRYCIVQ